MHNKRTVSCTFVVVRDNSLRIAMILAPAAVVRGLSTQGQKLRESDEMVSGLNKTSQIELKKNERGEKERKTRDGEKEKNLVRLIT